MTYGVFKMYQNLYKWGLSERFTQEAQLYDGLSLARVTEQHRQRYTVVSEDGFSSAVVSGKFIHSASCPSAYPATGECVMVKTEGGSSHIQHVLTR